MLWFSMYFYTSNGGSCLELNLEPLPFWVNCWSSTKDVCPCLYRTLSVSLQETTLKCGAKFRGRGLSQCQEQNQEPYICRCQMQPSWKWLCSESNLGPLAYKFTALLIAWVKEYLPIWINCCCKNFVTISNLSLFWIYRLFYLYFIKIYDLNKEIVLNRLGTTPDMRDSLAFLFQSVLKCWPTFNSKMTKFWISTFLIEKG